MALFHLGKLFPDEMTIVKLILAELRTVNKYGWLLDGFPRTLSQAKLLTSQQPLDAVLYLNVPLETIVDRVKERWIHLPSGRVYNLSYNPPKSPGKDDVTGKLVYIFLLLLFQLYLVIVFWTEKNGL